MNVITDLFSLVPQHAVRPAGYCAYHQIGKETVQLSTRVCWSREAATAKTNSRHSKITSIFLHQNVGGSFRGPKERMLAIIDTHRFRDSRLILMIWLDFPPCRQFLQWQLIWRVAVNLVRRSKNKWRFGAKRSRRFKQVQCTICINGEIGLRVARRPIV